MHHVFAPVNGKLKTESLKGQQASELPVVLSDCEGTEGGSIVCQQP
jgi:hypothetical protein